MQVEETYTSLDRTIKIRAVGLFNFFIDYSVFEIDN